MKILIVTPVFWPESFRINDFAQALSARGHTVQVLAGLPNYPKGEFFEGYGLGGPYEERREGVEVLRFPVFPRRKGRPFDLLVHYGSWALSGLLRVALLRPATWDRIFVFQTSPVSVALPAFLARWRSGAPVVMWVQDLWPDAVTSSGLLREGWLSRLLGRVSTWIYRGCDQVVTQSRAFGVSLEQRGLAGGVWSHVPNWAEAFYTVPCSVGRDGARFTILFAGNLGRGQGLPALVEAIHRLRSHARIQWRFIGEGSMKPWLQAEVERLNLGDKVTFLPACPPEDMPGHFATADALLVSLGRNPVYAMTVPGKVQSYLAAGRPILAALDGEGADLLRESGAGLVVPAEDGEGLAAAAARLADVAEDLKEAMGKNGRAFFQSHFSREVCIAALEAEILGARRRSRS